MPAKAKVEKDTAERWLLTYADLMNLLLIFFIILYSLSTVNQAAYEQFASAANEEFSGSQTSIEAAQQYWETMRQNEEDFMQDMNEMIKQYNLEDDVSVQIDARAITIILKDKAVFASGSADLPEQGDLIVRRIGSMLRTIPYRQILIEGHTDSDPLSRSSPYIDNLGLASARANNVYRVLAETLDKKLMSAISYGEEHPIAPNDTRENKAKNRRVVIILMRKSLVSTGAEPTNTDIPPELDVGAMEDVSETAAGSGVGGDTGNAADGVAEGETPDKTVDE